MTALCDSASSGVTSCEMGGGGGSNQSRRRRGVGYGGRQRGEGRGGEVTSIDRKLLLKFLT